MVISKRNNSGISSFATSWQRDVLLCLGLLLLCSLIGLLFDALGLSEANIISIYIVGILVISALVQRRGLGLASAVLGVLLFNWLYAYPRFTLFFIDLQYAITAAIMLVASLVISYIMAILRTHLEREKQATHRSDILLQTSQHLRECSATSEMVRIALQQVQQLSNRTTILYELNEPGWEQQPPSAVLVNGLELNQQRLRQDQQRLLQWLDDPDAGKAPLQLEHSGFDAHYFLIRTPERAHAIVGIISAPGEKFNPYVRKLIQAVLDDVALAVEKQELDESRARITHEAEAERLRSSLLQAVSHDLRTPLTSISGNADILLRRGDQLAREQLRLLYQDIHDDSEWLIHIVENLLFLSRLENGVMPVNLTPELLQEIIPEALSFLGSSAQDHRLEVELAEELLLVRVDGRLIIQVLVNIVQNAFKYTPPGSRVIVRATRQGEQAVVEVADFGPGISAADKPHVFDMFYTAGASARTGRRGLGLGLALCQSIMAAHNSEIFVRDNQPRGAVFGFTLDLEEINLESRDIDY